MTERERLIEILKVPIYPKEGVDPAEVVADYLLDNGVIVPPVKVGDVVEYEGILYYIENIICRNHIDRERSSKRFWAIPFDEHTDDIEFYESAIGTDVRILTKEEAEVELERRRG